MHFVGFLLILTLKKCMIQATKNALKVVYVQSELRVSASHVAIFRGVKYRV
jgi:hypothetical protein